ncbi:hypothetical protein NQ314_014556 [Rhamnusium bicolor]|uniref:Uncharacterized protein n=1 Tax=Rhamnusium bicolor TaxID=1586634 RepID=A0AAV8X207_9CUCU|nr:hypothetical protein NQ314_014556 [Rhamnusium bicolor]
MRPCDSFKIMLRSIFSLIQNIIDSDKEYNNRKSGTVIYLVSNPDNSLNMDLEIDGKPRENLRSLRDNEPEEAGSTFKITTEQGDMVTCKHFTDKKIVPKIGNKKEDEKLCEEYKEMVEKVGERTIFTNNEEIIGDREVGEEIKKLDEWDETKVHDLLTRIPMKQAKVFEKGKRVEMY